MTRLSSCTLLAALVAGSPLAADSFAITNVNVFDGEQLLDNVDVVITDETITAVGAELEIPAAAERIDGRGKTLLPGFIDAHAHSWGDALTRAAVFGVTTVLDMFTEPGFAAERRREQAAGEAENRADLLSAGVLATAPGGHGTQYGIDIPTLTTAAEADGWVAARLAEGSDFIKIVLEDGSMVGRPLPTLDVETLEALVRAAHERELLAVAHVTTYEQAGHAVAAGVDGLVHLFPDRAASAEWIAEVASGGLFVVPTLTVLESTTGVASGADLPDDPRLADYLTAAEVGGLRQQFPPSDATLEAANATLRALVAAGVPILAGSDAPNPGTAHGVSIHRELELLVAAGLTPLAALTAATATPAAAFGLDDRGRIAAGLRADLLLIDGDPLSDITTTRAIVGVWKAGHAIARPIQQPTAPSAALAIDTVADFESGELTAAFGSGWTESTDGMMGGQSTVALEVVAEGANGTAQALVIAGEIRAGFAFPWAGAMFFPGSVPMTPANLSAAKELVFWARGTAGSYRVLAFAESLGQRPTEQPFEVDGDWRQVVLSMDAFSGADAAGLTGLLWTAGATEGPFRLEIDEIELR